MSSRRHDNGVRLWLSDTELAALDALATRMKRGRSDTLRAAVEITAALPDPAAALSATRAGAILHKYEVTP